MAFPHIPQQDTRLIAKIRDRIWAETFEGQAYAVDQPKLREAVHDSLLLHRQLLISRNQLREVRAQAIESMKSGAMSRLFLDCGFIDQPSPSHSLSLELDVRLLPPRTWPPPPSPTSAC